MMRDLINILDTVLVEGVGLANRKPGEQFKNHVDDLVTFQGLSFYPQSGAYPEAELSDAVDQAAAANNTTVDRIHWTNAQPNGDTGFGIASFTDENNNPYFLGRWFKTVSPNRVQNNFPHNAIPGGFSFQSNAGKKESSGLKPSQWLTRYQKNTPQTILDQCIAAFGQNSAEADALAAFINSDIPVTVQRGNMNPTAFRDYFAEVLQPIALVMGKNVEGNARTAAEKFFGPGADFSDCTISFNENAIGGLYDSLLVNSDGKQIKLSSKGKNGASASVVNLQRSVDELSGTKEGAKLINDNQEVIDILNLIQKEGHIGAPLKLAVQYKMITPEEATQVLKLKNYGPADDVIGTGVLSKNLEKMYQGRSARDPSRIIPIEHMISAIAYPVADHVNKKTNFGSAASTILNNAALVQMYTDTRDNKDTITITKLTAEYPSQTVTGVVLDASKVYFSTGGKGNYTFTILKNGAKASDVNPIEPTKIDTTFAKISADDLDAKTQTRSGITAKAGGVAEDEAEVAKPPRNNVPVFGRKRQR